MHHLSTIPFLLQILIILLNGATCIKQAIPVKRRQARETGEALGLSLEEADTVPFCFFRTSLASNAESSSLMRFQVFKLNNLCQTDMMFTQSVPNNAIDLLLHVTNPYIKWKYLLLINKQIKFFEDCVQTACMEGKSTVSFSYAMAMMRIEVESLLQEVALKVKSYDLLLARKTIQPYIDDFNSLNKLFSRYHIDVTSFAQYLLLLKVKLLSRTNSFARWGIIRGIFYLSLVSAFWMMLFRYPNSVAEKAVNCYLFFGDNGSFKSFLSNIFVNFLFYMLARSPITVLLTLLVVAFFMHQFGPIGSDVFSTNSFLVWAFHVIMSRHPVNPERLFWASVTYGMVAYGTSASYVIFCASTCLFYDEWLNIGAFLHELYDFDFFTIIAFPLLLIFAVIVTIMEPLTVPSISKKRSS